MRKLVIITLILGLVLVGCTIRDSDKNTTNTPDLNLSETSKDQATASSKVQMLMLPQRVYPPSALRAPPAYIFERPFPESYWHRTYKEKGSAHSAEES